MSTRVYSIGDNVELSFTLGSTATTSPESASVRLIVTDPAGTDQVFESGDLGAASVPSSDSTATGWARWSKLLPVHLAGRWTYQFTSTGVILASAPGAFAVAGALASTST